ncbi:MAG: cupin domain-containing protein [Alphaproteobacteria bacterium]
MDQTSFEERLKSDGYIEIERKGLPAGESRAEHAHHFDVAALVVGGDITLTCDGERRTYRAGDTFTMAAGAMHTEDVGPAGVEYVVGRRY